MRNDQQDGGDFQDAGDVAPLGLRVFRDVDLDLPGDRPQLLHLGLFLLLQLEQRLSVPPPASLRKRSCSLRIFPRLPKWSSYSSIERIICAYMLLSDVPDSLVPDLRDAVLHHGEVLSDLFEAARVAVEQVVLLVAAHFQQVIRDVVGDLKMQPGGC